jgi:hypothetical protein
MKRLIDVYGHASDHVLVDRSVTIALCIRPV